jgi:hypothetical protein
MFGRVAPPFLKRWEKKILWITWQKLFCAKKVNFGAEQYFLAKNIFLITLRVSFIEKNAILA